MDRYHSGPLFPGAFPTSIKTCMRPYPLPKDITREEFNGLVTSLYQLLAAKGLDPVTHLTVGDFNDSFYEKTRPRFALYLSYTATEIILKSIE
jgi:hypothetical protein